MTPKEKAQELLNKMEIQTYSYQEYAGAHYTIAEVGYEAGKKCALIAVDEIIQTYHSPMDDEQIQEWQEVKQEINNL